MSSWHSVCARMPDVNSVTAIDRRSFLMSSRSPARRRGEAESFRLMVSSSASTAAVSDSALLAGSFLSSASESRSRSVCSMTATVLTTTDAILGWWPRDRYWRMILCFYLTSDFLKATHSLAHFAGPAPGTSEQHISHDRMTLDKSPEFVLSSLRVCYFLTYLFNFDTVVIND